MVSKRVAIIGAGVSGLPAIKCCLEEGFDPVCFEKRSDLGGLWNFQKNVEEDVGCVNLTTITNLNKESMSYSDFLHPRDHPNFISHQVVLEFLNSYANHFGSSNFSKPDRSNFA